MPLITALNLGDPDRFYDALVASHEGLSDQDSAAFDARLILILANHVGDDGVLTEALELARLPAGHETRGGDAPGGPPVPQAR